MATVTKKELIERVAERSKVNRIHVKKTIQEFLDQVISELKKGNRLEFRDFGVFEVKERAARQAQNPKTLARVEVPPKRTVKFKVGRLMRESVETYSSADRHSDRNHDKSEIRVPEIKIVDRAKSPTQV